MTGLDWPAMMRVGLSDLGLKPSEFWALSPAELLLLVQPQNSNIPIGRSGLDSLVEAFPDNLEQSNA